MLIWGRADSQEFLETLALAAADSGASPVVLATSDDYSLQMITGAPASVLERCPPHLLAMVERSDVVVTVSMNFADPERFRAVPPARMAARRRGMEPIRTAMLSGRRWVGMDFPTSGQAKAFGLDFDDYASRFWDAVMVDYAGLAEDCEYVAGMLLRDTSLRLTSPLGTDLVIAYAGRPLMKDDGIISDDDVAHGCGLSNLPAGEVCFAPLETEASGRLVVDLTFWDGNRIEELELEFERGRARPVRARRGFAEFVRVLESSSGDRDVIGELGIGLNPNVPDAIGCILLDEKIRGSVHVALGYNLMLGGVNVSDLHWDLLVLKPTITVGDTALIDAGRLVKTAGGC